MTKTELRHVRSALRKLGPKRVRMGRAAFRNLAAARSSFTSCFLARAYGKPGALSRRCARTNESYQKVLGLNLNEMWDTAMAFDKEPSVLRDLVETFLETSHANS